MSDQARSKGGRGWLALQRSRFLYLVRTRSGHRSLYRGAVVVLGAATAAAQGLIWLYNDDPPLSVAATLVWCLVLAAIVGVIAVLPPMKVVGRVDSQPVTFIELRIGDLCDQDGPIGLGVSDKIDDGFPETLHPSTLIAQLCASAEHLEQRDLLEVVWEGSGRTVVDPLSIGDLVRLDRGTKGPAYVVVFAQLVDGVTRSSPIQILAALESIWSVLRADGQEAVHLPIMGSGLGPAGLPKAAMVSLIAASFTLANRKSHVCSRLIINVRLQDYTPELFVHARQALDGLGYRT